MSAIKEEIIRFTEEKSKELDEAHSELLKMLPDLAQRSGYTEKFLRSVLHEYFKQTDFTDVIYGYETKESLIESFKSITLDRYWWDYEYVTADYLVGTDLFIFHAYMLGLDDWKGSCEKHFEIMIQGGYR